MSAFAKKIIWRLTNVVLTIALLSFAYNYITKLVQQASAETVVINWWLVAVSVVLFIVSCIVLAFHWSLSTRLLDADASTAQPLAFLASLPFKYLPTSFFTFSSRAYFGKVLGLTLKQGALVQVFENASLLVANILLFTVLYVAYFSLLAGFVLVVLIIVVMVFVVQAKKEVTLRIKKSALVIRTADLAKMLVLSAFGWFVCGLAFLTLVYALGLSIAWLRLLAGNTVAFSIGMVAFFAPGGIGVREFIYSSFGVASVAILYWRILVFALDFVMGGVAYVLIRFGRFRV